MVLIYHNFFFILRTHLAFLIDLIYFYFWSLIEFISSWLLVYSASTYICFLCVTFMKWYNKPAEIEHPLSTHQHHFSVPAGLWVAWSRSWRPATPSTSLSSRAGRRWPTFTFPPASHSGSSCSSSSIVCFLCPSISLFWRWTCSRASWGWPSVSRPPLLPHSVSQLVAAPTLACVRCTAKGSLFTLCWLAW